MKKKYVKPSIDYNGGIIYGLPTVLAVAAVGAAVGAASVAVGKMVGDIVQYKITSSKEILGVLS